VPPALPHTAATTPDDRVAPDGADPLPRSLGDAERAAERIASIARAAAGLIIAASLMAALFLVPASERVAVGPRVVVAIGIMFGFVVLAAISLIVSRRRLYRPILAYLFVLGDGLLIMLALYAGMHLSGHAGPLVFAQPPAWLIPIAISIQAVRFRSGPLIFAASLLLVEIAVLIAFSGPVTATAEATVEIARLFSVPADAVRGLMLAIAAAALIYSVRSKRDILIRGLSAARREAAMSRFLPPEVSRRLGHSDSARDLADEREIAVLFIDLIGFTRQSEKADPAAIAGWLSAFRTRLNALITQNGGFVDKFIGDSVMAIFGYESPPEEAAAQACRVVEAVPAALTEWQASDPATPVFQAAIGGAFGPAFVGVIDAGDRREFTVIGDTVNTAARLEVFAKETGVFAALGQQLVRRGGYEDNFGADARDFPIRGREEPVRTVLVKRR